MPILVPAPPAPPGPVNGDRIIDYQASYTIAAGTYLYGREEIVFFSGVGDVINHGTLYWSAPPGYYGRMSMAPYERVNSIVNDGTIVFRSDSIAADINVFWEFENAGPASPTVLTNSGSIWAFAEGTASSVVLLQSYAQVTIVNSGLLAAYAADSSAFALYLEWGGLVQNFAGGQILAEGKDAIAVRGGIVENAGLIEGRSNGGGIGYGTLGALVHNTGTITGDVGVGGESGLIDNRGTISGTLYAVLMSRNAELENGEAGIITGDVLLGNYADVVNNAGLITGLVQLDGGDDQFTNSGSGKVVGIVDLGLGNDTYNGSSDVDKVTGLGDNDTINGNAGNDLLFGGSGNDTIRGGAGNDGLFGELGNDRLISEGADVVSGGVGDDRIETSDYTFASIDGDEGFDSWVLPVASRSLNLTAALSGGRVEGIDQIELGSNKTLIVRATDVAAISDDNLLYVKGDASDAVYLAGSWSSQGTVEVQGVHFGIYASGASLVLIQQGAVVTIGNTPTAAGGLDAVAGGTAAPVPGAASGMDFTPTEFRVSGLEIRGTPLLLPQGETWYSFGNGPGVWSEIEADSFTVDGALIAINEDGPFATATQFWNGGTLINNGTIGAESYGDPILSPAANRAQEAAAAVRDVFFLTNHGLIYAYSAKAMASAVGHLIVDFGPSSIDPMGDTYTPRNVILRLSNDWDIIAQADAGFATGVVGYMIDNSGRITADGASGAIAVYTQGDVTNTGLIKATSDGEAFGLLLALTGGEDNIFQIVNDGRIEAKTAIEVRYYEPYFGSLELTNHADIIGDVVASLYADKLLNTGQILGDILLRDGNDLYDGRGGVLDGQLDAGLGDDTVYGGNEDNRFSGGGGNDAMDGGGGSDTAIFSGNRHDYAIASLGGGAYSVTDLRSGSPDGVDTITAFEFTRFADGAIAAAQWLGAANDVGTTDEAHSVAGNVLSNDSIESGPKTVTAVNGVVASVGQQITLASGAKLTLNANGSYTYNPNGKFNALVDASTGAANSHATDSFTYTVTGGTTATVTITINGVGAPGDMLLGDSGNNSITGLGTADVFNLSQGGNDSAYGLGGNDGFYFGAAMTGADHVDGGAGTLDQIGLQGNYTGGNALTFGVNGTLGVEMLVLLPGSDTRFGDTSSAFYSYVLNTIDANVGAGQQLIVNANTLRAGENLNFNGAAELDGSFLTYGGRGNDSLTGGQKVDGFFFGDGGRFGAGDVVDGQGQQAGGLDQLGLQGNYTGANALVFGANQIKGIEMIVLLSGVDARFGGNGSNFSYDLTMNDGNVAAGQKMIVNANTLLVAEAVTFNGAAETNGFFQIFGGAGDDSYTGSQGNDDIWGGGGIDTLTGGLGRDDLHGGAGNDFFRYTSAAQSVSGQADRILDFATGDRVDLSAIDAITGGADNAFSFVGSAAFVSNGVGQLQVINNGSGNWTVSADVNGNGTADLVLAVTVTDAHNLTAADFVL